MSVITHTLNKSSSYFCIYCDSQELAERYAPLLGLPVSEVGGALEAIRAQAVKRGKGNKTFRETNVATLELLLPRDSKKVQRLFKKPEWRIRNAKMIPQNVCCCYLCFSVNYRR